MAEINDKIVVDQKVSILKDKKSLKNDTTTQEKKSKNLRHRKKNFYNSIRKQMEFYFSDANLSKDRYLMKLITKNPYVQLDEFLKFNKIKNLITNLDDIRKAIRNSTILELNDDETKIHRLETDIDRNYKENIDLRTIYVENLPPTIDHERLKKIFSRYGQVLYVSLPRYRLTKKFKEFGFIEFDKEESVQKCLKAFRQFDGVLCCNNHNNNNNNNNIDTPNSDTTIKPATNYDPSELLSIKTFIKEKELEEKQQQQEQEELMKEQNQQNKDEGLELNEMIVETVNTKKRCRISSVSSSTISELGSDNEQQQEQKTNTKKYKKMKFDGNDEQKVDGNYDNENQQDQTEILVENQKQNIVDEKLNTVKKLKKKKSTKKHHQQQEQQQNRSIQQKLSIDNDLFDLRILPKFEWKRLRNKYLNLQRQQLKLIKKQLINNSNNNKQQQQNRQQQHEYKRSTNVIEQHHKKRDDDKYSMNFYCTTSAITSTSSSSSTTISDHNNLNVNNNETIENDERFCIDEKLQQQKEHKKPLFKYETGLIINLKFPAPNFDIKTLKNSLKLKYPTEINYIDIKDGGLETYIRCNTMENSTKLLEQFQQQTKDFVECRILMNDDEKLYWDKIWKDREMKLNKNHKINKLIKIENRHRGRDKLKKKIQTNHIRFDDD